MTVLRMGIQTENFTYTFNFQRFRLHNLFLKASKCKFGYSELDFAGKFISEEGLQMSRTRILFVYAKQ